MIGTQQEKSFVVSLKGVAHRIVSVRYEKDEGDLKLHFVLREGEKIVKVFYPSIENGHTLFIIVGGTNT